MGHLESESSSKAPVYRGRLAPSPTGHLHLGHAKTFWTAQERARDRGGQLVLRIEDIDQERCKQQFTDSIIEDLSWFGFDWQEGPDCGGEHAPYLQSQRYHLYHEALQKLQERGYIYPCTCSRKDILSSLSAPHKAEEEPLYPGTCRPGSETRKSVLSRSPQTVFNWRFRVPDGQKISFVDGNYGPQTFVAGQDFGDFIVWRHDDMPAYQLAIAVDDALMGITEVVRGADLLKSAARQLLIYQALGFKPPAFFHCPLLTDENGQRLAKRNQAQSLRELKSQGRSPEALREEWKNGIGN